MKQKAWAVGALSALMLFHSGRQALEVMLFLQNRDRIAAERCEQRSEPQNTCRGTCHLVKPTARAIAGCAVHADFTDRGGGACFEATGGIFVTGLAGRRGDGWALVVGTVVAPFDRLGARSAVGRHLSHDPGGKGSFFGPNLHPPHGVNCPDFPS